MCWIIQAQIKSCSIGDWSCNFYLSFKDWSLSLEGVGHVFSNRNIFKRPDPTPCTI